MADEEEPQCKVEYIDLGEGNNEETNWIKRAGKAKVTYVNGHTFEGSEFPSSFYYSIVKLILHTKQDRLTLRK